MCILTKRLGCPCWQVRPWGQPCLNNPHSSYKLSFRVRAGSVGILAGLTWSGGFADPGICGTLFLTVSHSVIHPSMDDPTGLRTYNTCRKAAEEQERRNCPKTKPTHLDTWAYNLSPLTSILTWPYHKWDLVTFWRNSSYSHHKSTLSLYFNILCKTRHPHSNLGINTIRSYGANSILCVVAWFWFNLLLRLIVWGRPWRLSDWRQFSWIWAWICWVSWPRLSLPDCNCFQYQNCSCGRRGASDSHSICYTTYLPHLWSLEEEFYWL